MSTEREQDFIAVRTRLLESAVRCKERARIGQQNEKKLKEINSEIDFYIEQRKILKDSVDYMTKIYKNIEEYVEQRKRISLHMLQDAIERAGMIVPDADIEGIRLEVGEKTAAVVNRDGQDINLQEGSAFRTVMGMLMRYTLLKVQPDKLQVMFLDEAFSTLSDSTSTVMREFIEAVKDEILIIGIEQRPTLFDGMEKTVYRAVKTGTVTEIRKE